VVGLVMSFWNIRYFYFYSYYLLLEYKNYILRVRVGEVMGPYRGTVVVRLIAKGELGRVLRGEVTPLPVGLLATDRVGR